MVLPVVSFAGEAESDKALGEVLVEGSRGELAKLRKQVRALEQQFLKRYNKLNTNKDFDVSCKQEKSTGTRVGRQSCRAAYQSKALQREAQEYLQYMQSDTGSAVLDPAAGLGVAASGDATQLAPVIGTQAQSAQDEIEARRDEYQQNVLDVASKDPELMELVRQLAALNERYAALQEARSSKK